MSKDPLLPILAGATAAPPTYCRKPLSTTISPSLLPLPSPDDVSLPLSPSSLKDRIIFGPSSETLTLNLIPSSSPLSLSPIPDPLFCRTARNFIHRSSTAPSISPFNALPNTLSIKTADPLCRPNPENRESPIVRNAFILLTLYLLFGVLVYSLYRADFVSSETHPFVDALYFCIVTMCTIGYGDITPSSSASKIFSIAFVLIGFGFVDILLSAMVSYVLDVQEHHLLDAAKKVDASSYVVDLKKGRMRIRLKVALALGVVVLCIFVGVGFLLLVERLSWIDAFYLSVMSVTTVGYGDRAFKTMGGRMFACIWLLVSTLAVARAFLFLVEARMDKRHREMAKWVLARNLTAAEFLEADIDNNGFVSKSEFVVYKLKEMGKVAEKDILQICDQFDRFDNRNCGKITLFDLIENDRKHDSLGRDIKR